MEYRELLATLLWQGDPNAPAGGAPWSVATNWIDQATLQPATSAPGIGDTARFTAASVNPCRLDVATIVGNLEIDQYSKVLTLDHELQVGGGKLSTLTPAPDRVTITGAGNLAIVSGATFTWNSGTMAGTGKTIVRSGATLAIPSSNGAGDDARLAGRTLEVASGGTVNFTSGRLYCQNDPVGGGPAAITNSGTFNISGTASSITAGNPATFTNAAGGRVMVNVGGSQVVVSAGFNNQSSATGGGVSVTAGDLTLTGGGKSTGTWAVGAGSFARFAQAQGAPAPQFTWGAGTEFTGAGRVRIQSAEVTIPGGVTVLMDAWVGFAGGKLRAGLVGGRAVLDARKQFDWFDGSTEGFGAIHLAGTSNMLVCGDTVLAQSSPTLAEWNIENSGSIFIGRAPHYPAQFSRVDFRVGDAATIRNLGAAQIVVLDTSHVLTIPNRTRGAIAVGNGQLVKARNSGHSDFQVSISSTNGSLVRQIENSSFRILDQQGNATTGVITAPQGNPQPEKKTSFRGPIEFDSNPLTLQVTAELGGWGEITTATFQNDGTALPGEAGEAGVITFVGNYTQTGTGTLAIDLGGGAGAVGGTDYDQIVVSGAASLVSLDGALALSLLPTFDPAARQFTVINNLSSLPVTGTFAGLPEGAVVYAGTRRFQITYKGGPPMSGGTDGNDVVLTLVGSVTGRVWEDTDEDGIEDGGEPGVPGVTVRLLDPATAAVVAETATGGDGSYLFETVPIGTYDVKVVTDRTFTLQNQGTNDTIDSDFDGGGLFPGLVVPDQPVVEHLDAGLLPVDLPPAGAAGPQPFWPGGVTTTGRGWRDAGASRLQDVVTGTSPLPAFAPPSDEDGPAVGSATPDPLPGADRSADLGPGVLLALPDQEPEGPDVSTDAAGWTLPAAATDDVFDIDAGLFEPVEV